MSNIDYIHNKIMLKELNNIDCNKEKGELLEVLSTGMEKLNFLINDNIINELEQEYANHIIRNKEIYQNCPDYPIEKYKYFLWKLTEISDKAPNFTEDVIGYRRTLDQILQYIELNQLSNRAQENNYICRIEEYKKYSGQDLLKQLIHTISEKIETITYSNIEDIAYEIKDILFVFEMKYCT